MIRHTDRHWPLHVKERQDNAHVIMGGYNKEAKSKCIKCLGSYTGVQALEQGT